MRVIATGAEFRRGVRATLPRAIGLMPFAHVVGVLAQAQGLSALEQALMSAIVRRDRVGRHDVLFHLGAAATLWSAWLATTMPGHALGGGGRGDAAGGRGRRARGP
jgi:predicted branched-subunit amino acid permease